MLALLPATLVMLFVARVWRRGLLMAAIAAAIAAAAVLAAVYEAERPGVTEARKAAIMKFVPLRPHQVKRVKIFLFPDEDPHAAGYTLRQAMISIGSGGFSGKGFRKGETNHLKYLPQSISMNDFIFCVYAEEAGFCVRACLHKHSDVDRARSDHGAAAAVHIGRADVPRDGDGRPRHRPKRINA